MADVIIVYFPFQCWSVNVIVVTAAAVLGHVTFQLPLGR